MNDKMKTVREALDRAMKDEWTEESVREALAAIAALDSMEAEAHPKAQGEVELTEDDIERLSMDAMATPTHDGDVTWIPAEVECSNRALRHITSKYRLIPR